LQREKFGCGVVLGKKEKRKNNCPRFDEIFYLTSDVDRELKMIFFDAKFQHELRVHERNFIFLSFSLHFLQKQNG
jgi:hypothetical protein